ncbi:hypothetical protein [Microcoleus sp. AT3-D2]|uniref:hypothetical protein n=1 Tax=Microcoleus sp. AT3-D2 TaxID=2818612 RepID=UPI002FD1DF9C
MISNPRFIVGRKVKSSWQQIIRAIFIFLTHSQQSTITGGATGIDIIPISCEIYPALKTLEILKVLIESA